MNQTRAILLEHLARPGGSPADTGQPVCPSCKYGRIHPFEVAIGVQVERVTLTGYVGVCVGNRDANAKKAQLWEAEGIADRPELVEHPPCGFAMSLVATAY